MFRWDVCRVSKNGAMSKLDRKKVVFPINHAKVPYQKSAETIKHHAEFQILAQFGKIKFLTFPPMYCVGSVLLSTVHFLPLYFSCIYMQTYIHTRIHTYIYTHTYIHTYKHTYI